MLSCEKYPQSELQFCEIKLFYAEVQPAPVCTCNRKSRKGAMVSFVIRVHLQRITPELHVQYNAEEATTNAKGVQPVTSNGVPHTQAPRQAMLGLSPLDQSIRQSL